MQDDSVEYDECFEFSISLPDSVSDLIVVIDEGRDTSTMCIEDDDSKLILCVCVCVCVCVLPS